MSYALAMERLAALGQELHTAPDRPRRKFELDQMRALMSALGDPQKKYHSILIAGTNGKGSTSSTLSSILVRSGYRTGLYTSPHLSRVNERVQVDGLMISDEDFASLFFRVEEVGKRLVQEGTLPALPSYFETVTAIAFAYFAERQIHTAVLEVGMGGRLDATNIVEPLLSVITDISLDHMEWLGSTIREIAKEKAGILRPGGIMVTLPQHPEANQALGETAEELGVRGVNAAVYVPYRESSPELDSRNRYPLAVLGEHIVIDSALAGAHQQRNLALAIAAAIELRNSYSYDITPSLIAAGIQHTVWPGRLEQIPGDGRRPSVLLDVGHNPAGAWSLRAAVSSLNQDRPMTLLFGCLNDKPVEELAQILFPLFEHVVVTPVDSPRSASLERLEAAGTVTGSAITGAANAEQAILLAFDLTPPEGLVVVTGSVFLIGKLREELTTPPFAVAETLHT